jgi:flavin-dependent dehydrogenase
MTTHHSPLTTHHLAIAATLNLAEAGARSWDVIVVGAGPAGSLAARQSARHGASVLLVDKACFPRAKVCGACLNLRALSTLAAVGLGGLVERCGAIPLASLKLAVSGAQASVSLPGRALSRAVFDAALVDAAVVAGAHFLPETRAHLAPVIGQARALVLRHNGQEALAHGRVVLGADGLGGRLLHTGSQAQLGNQNRTVVAADSRLGAGVITKDYPAFFGRGTVYMACGKGGYVGLVRIEDGRLNIAASLDAAFVKKTRGLGQAAAAILRVAGFPPIDGLETLGWHGTPLLTRHVWHPAADRVFLLGDAASYVEPFSGEGMAWALASAVAVAPFALRACRDWNPSLVRKWSMCYRHTILRRQRVCRAAAKVLRQPNLVRLIVGALTHFPVLAAPVVRYVNYAGLWQGFDNAGTHGECGLVGKGESESA